MRLKPETLFEVETLAFATASPLGSRFFFFFNDTATTEIYTLSLHDALPITHAASWKGIVPSLARRFTVVTTDGRGTGRSDRPRASERYAPAEVTADLLAVLDAVGVGMAFL